MFRSPFAAQYWSASLKEGGFVECVLDIDRWYKNLWVFCKYLVQDFERFFGRQAPVLHLKKHS